MYCKHCNYPLLRSGSKCSECGVSYDVSDPESYRETPYHVRRRVLVAFAPYAATALIALVYWLCRDVETLPNHAVADVSYPNVFAWLVQISGPFSIFVVYSGHVAVGALVVVLLWTAYLLAVAGASKLRDMPVWAHVALASGWLILGCAGSVAINFRGV